MLHGRGGGEGQVPLLRLRRRTPPEAQRPVRCRVPAQQMLFIEKKKFGFIGKGGTCDGSGREIYHYVDSLFVSMFMTENIWQDIIHNLALSYPVAAKLVHRVSMMSLRKRSAGWAKSPGAGQGMLNRYSMSSPCTTPATSTSL